MIERQMELGRRQHRKKKMRKLKAKLAATTGADREKVLYKIKRLSPWWTEASLTQKQNSPKAATSGEKKERPAKKEGGSDRPGPKGPPKPKADKK
ncbi:MAG: hypothetical protein MUF18_20320 [Fimbriiglobus sp.]|jgi:hypothetical protein|nr:hypothetical protein [Fimbriiglobus sp.]